MKKKDEFSKKEPGRSSGIESLVKETENLISSYAEDPAPFLERIRSIPSADQEEIFRTLIQNREEEIYPFFRQLMGREEKTDMALAESLGRWISPEAGILLHQLASRSGARGVIKSIRKSIFRLKSRGVEVRDLGDSTPAVFRPPQLPPSEGLVSSPDAGGSRLVWLLRPQIPQGIMAFQSLVSDTQGILDFIGFETSRKKFHEYVDEFRKQAPWEIVEAEPEYCLGLIFEAEEINRQKKTSPPEDFLKAKALLGSPPPAPLKPLIYLHLKEEEWRDRPDLFDRAGSLFQTPAFRDWHLEEEETKKYLALLKEASESPLVLTPYQKEARVLEIYRQAVEEVFPKERRSLYRRRLEEMAYVLWKSGKESDAQMTLTAGLGMESEGGLFSTHPFLLELVKKSLTAALDEEAEKAKKEDDVLIKP